MVEITLNTRQKAEMVDITVKVREAVRECGLRDGVCVIFVPHTTAGIVINENADPDVKRDILDHLARLVPSGGGYSHMEGNAPAHIKSSIVGASCSVIVHGGELVLGTWQGIFFCEFDGPRRRKVYLQMVPSPGS